MNPERNNINKLDRSNSLRMTDPAIRVNLGHNESSFPIITEVPSQRYLNSQKSVHYVGCCATQGRGVPISRGTVRVRQ